MDDKNKPNLPMKVEADNMKELRQWGSLAVSGKVVPYGTTVEQAMAIVQVGREYGIQPFNALRNFFFVNGKIGTSADFLAAQARKHGIKIEVIESTDTICTMRFTRPDEKPVDVSWTIEDAKKAGLLYPKQCDKPDCKCRSNPTYHKSNWEKFPRQMLRARVKSDGSRLTDDATVGLYTQDELIESGEVIQPAEVVAEIHLEKGLADFTKNLGKKEAPVISTPPAEETQQPEEIVYISAETAKAIMDKITAIGQSEAEICIDLNIGSVEKMPESKLNEARDWVKSKTPPKPVNAKRSK